MNIAKTERIGKVSVKLIRTNHTDAPVYSDGPVENELYQRFKSNRNFATITENNRFASWAHEYHLSFVRQNLLRWFPFDPDGNVLEVGAGCGALTGLLCNKLRKVTALEYSYRRALVTAQRHSECSNLEVIVGGLQDYESDCKFDYITVIGVLEYAGEFYGGKNPHESLLSKVRCMLSPNGALILAIENKIGLKYICGAPEDHTGCVFDSIYSYPGSTKLRTFSKKELTNMLHSAGYRRLDWYYPVPDYKMPQQVLSERTVPSEVDSVWGLYPARTVGLPRKEILSERRFGKCLARAGLFGEFANSFLIVARPKDTCERFRCLRFVGADLRRKRDIRTNIRICESDQEKLVVRSADNENSVQFLQDLVEREALAKEYFSDYAEVITGKLDGSSLYYRYVGSHTLVQLMAESISDGDSDFGRSWLDEYLHFLRRLPSIKCVPEKFMKELGIASHKVPKSLHCFCCGITDCIPRNIIVGKKKWYIIDNKWTYDFPVPVDFVIFRAIHTLMVDLQAHIQSYVSKDHPVILFSGYGKNRHWLPLSWWDILRSLEVPIRQQIRWSSLFQNNILLHRTKPHFRLKTKPRIYRRVPISEIATDGEGLQLLRRVFSKVLRVLRTF